MLARLCEQASWLLTSLGVALLALSFVLVPTNSAFGQVVQPTGVVVCDYVQCDNQCYSNSCATPGIDCDVNALDTCSRFKSPGICNDCNGCKQHVFPDNFPNVSCICMP
jgi:hypothetical protein